MRLLLDTHAMLWLLEDRPDLGPAARALLAKPGVERLVSTASLWEIAIKAATGKVVASPAAVDSALAPSGLRLLDLTRDHVLALATLPFRRDHRDPFDRMLVAQAMHEGMTLMTADPKLAACGVPTVGRG